jgi:hypothetical protein
VAEGARLESVFRGNSNVGSNPTLSASSLLMRIGLPDGLTSTPACVIMSTVPAVSEPTQRRCNLEMDFYFSMWSSLNIDLFGSSALT